MIATTDAGKKKNSSPQTKLPIALPLVGGGVAGIEGELYSGALTEVEEGTETDAGAAAIVESRPQTRQKRSPSGILFPQPVQNGTASSSSEYVRRLILNVTLRLAPLVVNPQDWFGSVHRTQRSGNLRDNSSDGCD